MSGIEAPDTLWHKGVIAATAGWLIVVFGVNAVPTSVFGLVFFVSWVLLPVSIYKDSEILVDLFGWPKRRWAYILSSGIWVIGFIPGLLYLWRRRKIEDMEISFTVEASVQGPDGEEFTVSSEDVEDLELEDADLDFQVERIEYEGAEYRCDIVESSNGEWRSAAGRSFTVGEEGRPNHRFFLLESDDIRFSTELETGQYTDVSNTGIAAVIDGLSNEERSGKLMVYNESGEQLVSHFFNSNVGGCTVSGDGDYVAASTLSPDCSTYIFEVEYGDLILEHENIRGNKMGLEFEEKDGGYWLYLADSEDDNAYYAVDLEGELVWKSEELQREERLEELVESSETEDLEEAIELLDEAYELAEDSNEKKNVARKLADAHWKLAKEIKREEGDTDSWWSHLNQAKMYYTEILPWYDGKQGVAKVSRKQGKYHLKQGNEETALKLFQNIADLEEEYDVQLLTDADKEKLESLGS